jgi:hypothetical protein
VAQAEFLGFDEDTPSSVALQAEYAKNLIILGFVA